MKINEDVYVAHFFDRERLVDLALNIVLMLTVIFVQIQLFCYCIYKPLNVGNKKRSVILSILPNVW